MVVAVAARQIVVAEQAVENIVAISADQPVGIDAERRACIHILRHRAVQRPEGAEIVDVAKRGGHRGARLAHGKDPHALDHAVRGRGGDDRNDGGHVAEHQVVADTAFHEVVIEDDVVGVRPLRLPLVLGVEQPGTGRAVLRPVGRLLAQGRLHAPGLRIRLRGADIAEIEAVDGFEEGILQAVRDLFRGRLGAADRQHRLLDQPNIADQDIVAVIAEQLVVADVERIAEAVAEQPVADLVGVGVDGVIAADVGLEHRGQRLVLRRQRLVDGIQLRGCDAGQRTGIRSTHHRQHHDAMVTHDEVVIVAAVDGVVADIEPVRGRAQFHLAGGESRGRRVGLDPEVGDDLLACRMRGVGQVGHDRLEVHQPAVQAERCRREALPDQRQRGRRHDDRSGVTEDGVVAIAAEDGIATDRHVDDGRVGVGVERVLGKTERRQVLQQPIQRYGQARDLLVDDRKAGLGDGRDPTVVPEDGVVAGTAVDRVAAVGEVAYPRHARQYRGEYLDTVAVGARDVVPGRELAEEAGGSRQKLDLRQGVGQFLRQQVHAGHDQFPFERKLDAEGRVRTDDAIGVDDLGQVGLETAAVGGTVAEDGVVAVAAVQRVVAALAEDHVVAFAAIDGVVIGDLEIDAEGLRVPCSAGERHLDAIGVDHAADQQHVRIEQV